jgi:hypothetical protein
MKTITKEYTVYDFEDLKQDDELCEMIYQKFWIDNPNNINPWADENLDSFGLLNDEYQTRQCFIKLVPDYDLSNKDYKELLKDYTGNGYCFCDDLANFTNTLLDKKEYKVLGEGERYKAIVISTDDFVSEIQNKMFELWFEDNQYYFSKESFLDHVESNRYEFDENGYLI